MAYTLTYNHPHFPEGMLFGIPGLEEAVPNGSTVTLDEDMERGFMMVHGRSLEDAFKGNALVELSGSSALDKNEIDTIVAMYNPPEVLPLMFEEKEEPDFSGEGEGGELDG